jgi:hypothetical protein
MPAGKPELTFMISIREQRNKTAHSGDLAALIQWREGQSENQFTNGNQLIIEVYLNGILN